MIKTAHYTSTNTYETLNKLNTNTKNVWLVFHGIGYLSKFFLRHFSSLNPKENYVIGLQAPFKYYKNNNYKHVGACWLTKENTAIDTENVLNYVDSVCENENIDTNTVNFIVLGYSQGVSIATRWLALRKQYCHTLVMISGVFPKELKKQDFEYIPNLKIYHTVGLKDEIFDPKNVTKQEERLKDLFKNIEFLNHEGGHKLDINLLQKYTS